MMKTLRIQQVFKCVVVAMLLGCSQCFATSSANQRVKDANKPSELASSATEPHSVTRLHQIWTSTSSDRLDELSPELISKLKADVPFLEAYALRPRLVGASQSAIQPLDRHQQATKEAGLSGQSSDRRANYLSLPSFSGFSELKVESASVSKTEHHHKRSASLKKRAGDSANGATIKRANNNAKQVNRAFGKRKRFLNKLQRSTHASKRRALYQDSPTKTNADKLEPEEGQVKGGSPGGRKEPFYAKAAPDREDRHHDDNQEDAEAEAEEEGPQRVGDEDVEEGGDAVMVEPKSDGVDDDPELPDYDEGSSTGDEKASGKRVDREQPGDLEGEGAYDDEDDSEHPSTTAGADTPAGDGLEGTTEASKETGGSSDSETGVTSGVERADRDFFDNKSTPTNKERAEKPKSLGEDSGADEKHETDPAEGRPAEGVEPESDLEYRDNDGGDYSDAEDEDEAGPRKKQQHGPKDAGERHEEPQGGRKAHRKHHHNDEEHEHEHSIECLEDAVPGRPGVDYPILSRVNATSFRCHHHKYPGYYADTEADCQVFHFCRADGTQDSFLCPNGTIFSQKTSVCVWWNSFQCEDAPKYVGLNALLYKHRGGPQDEAVSADRHPIDGLIEAMKQRPSSKADDKTKSSPNSETDDSGSDREPLAHSDGKTSRRKDAAAGFDESAVQRKSSVADADDDSADAGVQRRRAAARFSSPANGNQWPRQASNNNNNISTAPRRKRRASTRQAPPKLKSSSRRYMRPSRRVAYRIKNVSKPKRRS